MLHNINLFNCRVNNSGLGGEYNFRKTKWGMSKENVLASETLKPVQRVENLIGYKTVVIDKNVFVVYIFVQNKLVRAKYLLAETHSNKNDFIQDYEDFKKILTKKYGISKKDEVFWRNDLYKDDHAHWGTAVGLGHLIYFSEWETDATEVVCILKGENYDIDCGVEYASKDLKQLEEKQREKKAMDAF